jgi:hypothetical protein
VISLVSPVGFALDAYHLTQIVAQLRTRDSAPVSIIKRAQSIAWLLAWATIDQRGRNKKLPVEEWVSLENCRSADRLWHLIPAAYLDRQGAEFSAETNWSLIVESGGLLALASGISTDELAKVFQSTALHIQHVNGIPQRVVLCNALHSFTGSQSAFERRGFCGAL